MEHKKRNESVAQRDKDIANTACNLKKIAIQFAGYKGLDSQEIKDAVVLDHCDHFPYIECSQTLQIYPAKRLTERISFC